ncbi:MAG: ABC transporter ATP-binding protein [Firmicutes bacterium]|nr:ABC transporter ATP-binding protein [Bacillota bacterium]
MLRLFKYYKPYILPSLMVAVCIITEVAAGLFLPKVMSMIVNFGVAAGNIPYIYQKGLLMLGISAIGSLAAIGINFFSAHISSGFGHDLRQLIFNKAETLAMADFEKIGTNSLITRTTNDVQQIQSFFISVLRVMLMAPVTLVFGLIMMISTSLPLSAVLLISAPALVILIYTISKQVVPAFFKQQKTLDKLNKETRELLDGKEVIRAFNGQEVQEASFESANNEWAELNLFTAKKMALMMPGNMLIQNLTTVAILWLSADLLSDKVILIGDVMAFLQYLTHILGAFSMAANMFSVVPRAQVSANRILEVLDTKSEDTDNKQEIELQGNISFRNVSFHYPDSQVEALSDLSFDIKAGEKVCIIGGAGSGKTTLCKLLMGFYQPTSGEILIDGIPLQDISAESLQKLCGFVPQKNILLSGSVAKNLRFGNVNADDEELRRALRLADAEEFIDKKDGNLRYKLSQGGNNLSGGQKQRLAMARAFIKKPKLVILDDAFSALDYKTDAIIRSSVYKEFKDATLLMITQRVNSMSDCDQILVMDEGRLEAKGTHEELMEISPTYRELVMVQQQEVVSA